MALKIEQKCDRCRRDDDYSVTSAAEAVQAEELEAQRDAKAKEIEEYLNAVPPELMPDVIAFVKGKGVIHTHVCNIGDAKRSCLKRVTDLVKQIDALEERKPRAKKSEAIIGEPA